MILRRGFGAIGSPVSDFFLPVALFWSSLARPGKIIPIVITVVFSIVGLPGEATHSVLKRQASHETI